MVPIDMRKVHLFMGLTHPAFGPACFAVYSAVLGYSCFRAWLQLLADSSEFQRPDPR
jgi:hypothetical protein